MRPGTGRGGAPPMTGTLSATGRPSSGARLGTATRLGTASQPVYTGVGLNTEVQVADRPVTQHGMRGMRPQTSGPGRQIQDASYFAGMLRSKNMELQKEIARLKRECEQHHRDSSTYQQLERKYETLIKEVRNLEGQLADYNLAMDKSRTSTDPREITQYYMSLRAKNEREAATIDEIFIRRQQREREAQQVEEEIGHLQRRAVEKMEALPQAMQDRYQQLITDNQRFNDDITRKQAELEHVNQRIQESEDQLRRDPFRDEYAKLEKQLIRLRKERDDLHEEAKNANMDPEQARLKLLEKTKEDSARLKHLTQREEELQELLAQRKKLLQDLNTDIEERKSEAGDSHKYEVLYQRDQEMTEFIDKFEETYRREVEQQQLAQNQVVALLQHISKDMERQGNLPSKARVDEMRDDLGDKFNNLETAAQTQARLQSELAKRKEELKKIETLDSKIAVEMTSLTEKIGSMEDEMKVFQDIDSLRGKSEQRKVMLTSTRDKLKYRRDMIRQQVKLLANEYDRKKTQLTENETSKALDSLEQRLRKYEQTIFQLREYIETKGRETEYAPIADECQRLTDDVNAQIIRAQANLAPAMTAAPY